MNPLDFMQRLAALVPRPRQHLIRFHGVRAPNAKLRSRSARSGSLGPGRTASARLLERVFDIDMQHGPSCGTGELEILNPLVLDPQPPPSGRAREAAHERRATFRDWPNRAKAVRSSRALCAGGGGVRRPPRSRVRPKRRGAATRR
jgi:hypothetical protein